ncbi:HD domain-containing protein [Anaerosinus massiliensis]|uniref:phosphohydrolase n=1 Tax=Massilibacillus massiliensis TaxID=1806837 RepID=UPI000A5BC5AA|nr:phosphohydrolase [Massilibacillus massiliensis]
MLHKILDTPKLIGAQEELDDVEQEILEIAALTHDIGIKNSELKYQSSSGNYQQIEGPPEAKIMLENIGVDGATIDRICWLIAHHHTYHTIDSIDYQILVEADFLVNIFEDEMPVASIRNIREKIFKTKAGLQLLDDLYLQSCIKGDCEEESIQV